MAETVTNCGLYMSLEDVERIEPIVQETVRKVLEQGRYIDAQYKASLGSIAITPEELYLSDRANQILSDV